MHPLAGKPAPASVLVSIPQLIAAYYVKTIDPRDPLQRIAFGTSGHRGSSFHSSFNEAHIAAATQAVCDVRREHGIDGPLFLGIDTHGLSEPALETALGVLAANSVTVCVDAQRGFTPTPVVSHAIVTYNRGRRDHLADGIVVTPSHNPPEDGGFKYNPPHGGPAEGEITKVIEDKANKYLEADLAGVQRVTSQRAWSAATTQRHDYISAYVNDLPSIVNLPTIAAAKLRIGVDPLGGAAVAYWPRIAEQHKIDLEVVNTTVDPRFAFMRLDHDGRIRMDCSSPYAMAGLVELRERFDIAFGNDADVDRHGIVTPRAGLLNPNHFLAIAVDYLSKHRPGFSKEAAVGKTLVSSSLIDRVAQGAGKALLEVPVGFKWFVDGLSKGTLFFAGEESAGASFLRQDGTTWTTDKDGIVMDLLAAEIRAVTGRDLAEAYAALTARYGTPYYARRDVPAAPAQKALLGKLDPSAVKTQTLAGDPITSVLTRAPGNGASLGGLKVSTANGWFAARPSGTENVYKIYAESFKSESHLTSIQTEAEALVQTVLGK
jgi:phosphoglucomutase